MAVEVVRLDSVHKSYRLGETQVPALKGASLALHQGEFTALVGSSGSGKSTLLNIVGTIDRADRGSVFFKGRDLADLDEVALSALRNHEIGFVFQSFNLVPVLNVAENVELPLLIRRDLHQREKTRRIRQVIEDVGLAEFIKHRPDQLSGGQRQRVAIARALVTTPSLVLADEPTANLDSVTAGTIIDLMLNLNKNHRVTFLFCSHDEKLVSRVDRVLRIQDGIIVS